MEQNILRQLGNCGTILHGWGVRLRLSSAGLSRRMESRWAANKDSEFMWVGNKECRLTLQEDVDGLEVL